MAIYKTRNTGMGNGIREMRRIGGMLYSGECRKTFWGMFSNIPGNVLKSSGECCQTFREMSSNIAEKVAKHSREYRQTFRRMSQNIPVNFVKLLSSLVSECFTVHYVLISSNQSEYLYSFPVCKNALPANAKETF